MVSLVELWVCQTGSIIGLESKYVLFSMLDIFNGAISLSFDFLNDMNKT